MGNPLLDQALAWVLCSERHEEYDGGDHTIVPGAVRALGARDGAAPPSALPSPQLQALKS